VRSPVRVSQLVIRTEHRRLLSFQPFTRFPIELFAIIANGDIAEGCSKLAIGCCELLSVANSAGVWLSNLPKRSQEDYGCQ
jgi:hypothetical protein